MIIPQKNQFICVVIMNYHLFHISNKERIILLNNHSAKQSFTFAARLIAKKTPPGQRMSVKHQGYICHTYKIPEGLCCIAICDEEYPARVAFSLTWKLIQDFQTQYQYN